MKKIGIRADGGENIGMGHVMRTLVLAKELAKGNEVFYICRADKTNPDKYEAGIEKIKSEGFSVKIINESFLLEELSKIEAHCLITDNYDVDEEYFNVTKNIFNKTGYIDDMNLYYHNVDFIINQNMGAEELCYKANPNTKLFLGSSYILLREEFRKFNTNRFKDKAENVLITLGGSDPYKVTEKLLNYISDLKYCFHVVVGPAFKGIEALEKIKQQSNNIKLHYNPPMVQVMQQCDAAVSAAGSTLYELSACQIPTLAIMVAENQRTLVENMDKREVVINLGWQDKLVKQSLRDALIKICENSGLREAMVKNQRVNINKNGVEKLSMEINEILKVEC